MNAQIKIFYIAVLIFSCFIHCTSFSQPATEWVQRFSSPGNYNDYVTDMAIDKSGNVYLTGYTIKSTFDYDIITIKYNSSGIFQWLRSYDGPAKGEDIPIGIQIGKTGFIYVGASIQDTGGNYNLDYFVIKYDLNGDTVWTSRFNTFGGLNNADVAKSMALDLDDNIILTGYGGSSCVGCPEAYVTVKWNSDGVIQWSRIYKGPSQSSDFARDIITDDSENVYVSGMVVGTFETITIKYNHEGDTVWIRESMSGGNLLRIKSDELYLLEANRRILRYDLDGNLYWTVNNVGVYFDMLVSDSNSVYLSGTISTGMSGSSTITKKINIHGDSVWSKNFQAVPFSNNRVVSIAKDKNSNIFVIGYSDYNTPWNRFLALSYDKTGNLLWSKDYNNNNPFLQHEAVKVKTDTTGNIFVAGNSQGNGSGWDIALIKYSMLTEVNQLSNNEPREYKLYPNYPNPFNPITNIKYEIPLLSDIEFLIINVSGEEIFKFTNTKIPPGSYNFEFNGNNLPSGIYFLRFIADNKLIKTQKLILIK